jgi:hypothetical protein
MVVKKSEKKIINVLLGCDWKSKKKVHLLKETKSIDYKSDITEIEALAKITGEKIIVSFSRIQSRHH